MTKNLSKKARKYMSDQGFNDGFIEKLEREKKYRQKQKKKWQKSKNQNRKNRLRDDIENR